MKIKYAFCILLSALMLISFSQIFSIPPFEGDIFKIYRSGYFSELERGFGIIADSFIGIKTLGKPVYGWIFLQDVKKNYAVDVRVFDEAGKEVFAPGEKSDTPDEKVAGVLNTLKPELFSEIRFGKYYSVLPVYGRNECRFCHRGYGKKGIIGALTFERGYNAGIYYSSERILIFIVITILLGGMLFCILRWDPEKTIKNLFGG